MLTEQLLPEVLEIATLAGQRVLNIYEHGDYVQRQKDDDSPVTSADFAANDVIIQALKGLSVSYPILSEESDKKSLAERTQWQRYWLIDPIDGTGEFIAGSGDFAISIALVEGNVPILGVVHAPVSGVSYYGIKGQGAWKINGDQRTLLHATRLDNRMQTLRFAVSRRQRLDVLTEYLPADINAEFIPYGSSTLKACMVAEGKADCYLRVGPTGEWDTGAVQVIVSEAGGKIISTRFKQLTYNERDTLMNPNFMVLGDPNYPWQDVFNFS